MIWGKTEAGRVEMQRRALVKERARRNLLLLIDGVKTEAMLLEGVSGITLADFHELKALGLIAPLAAPASSRGGRLTTTSGGLTGPRSGSAPLDATPPPVEPLGYAEFTAALTQIISSELGLRGFVLTLALEKASTNEDLHAVAARALAQIADRKGEARAAAARRVLYGK